MYESLEQAIETFTNPNTWEDEPTPPTRFRFFLEHDPDLSHEMMCEAVFEEGDRWISRFMVLSGFDSTGRPVVLSDVNPQALKGHEIYESLYDLPASDPHFAFHETRFVFPKAPPVLAARVGLKHPFGKLLDAYETARSIVMGDVSSSVEVPRHELALWQIELVERFDSDEPEAKPFAQRVDALRLDWLRVHLLAPHPRESELEESAFLAMLRESRQERWDSVKPGSFRYDRVGNLLTFEGSHPLEEELVEAVKMWFGRYPQIECPDR